MTDGCDKDRGAERVSGVVEVINPDSSGPLLLVCEHASRHIPESYGSLGLSDDLLASHIAWDPGARPVALALAEYFNSPLVAQRISRLVYDCNRPPEAASAIPAKSEIHQIPGNAGLTEAARLQRITEVYQPFRERLAGELCRCEAAAGLQALVTIHSFTPVYAGVARDVEIGILHDEDARLADAMMAAAQGMSGYLVQRNEPYGPADGVTHTLREHALERGLPNVMIEIRNDLVADEAGIRRAAKWLFECLGTALATLAKDGMADGGNRAGGAQG